MSDEEKKAIEDSKELINELNNKQYRDFIGRLYYKNIPIEDTLQILLNLIDKQQKEIERLKTDYLIPSYILKEINELQTENTKNKDLLEGNLYKEYIYYKNLAGEYQGSCISKQKIKDKIEELKEEAYTADDEMEIRYDCEIELLQGILKEK